VAKSIMHSGRITNLQQQTITNFKRTFWSFPLSEIRGESGVSRTSYSHDKTQPSSQAPGSLDW